MNKSMTVIAVLALVLSASTGAFAAKGLLTGAEIQNGSLTGADVKQRSLGASLFTSSTRSALRGAPGATGAQGSAGPTGSAGAAGTNGGVGSSGTNGLAGTNGVNGLAGTNGGPGASGTNGTNGLAGTNGLNGLAGTNGAAGLDGTDGADGADGLDGANGTIAPLSATAGQTVLPPATPPTTVVELTVPAGNYVILAKTQLSHPGAGDSIDCLLKAGAVTLDRIAMKTLPALAAVPASLQAVTTLLAPATLSVECDVMTAGGTADFSSLIAVPTA